MEQVRQLRVKAAQWRRLARGINNPADVAKFEDIAAKFEKDASEIEASGRREETP